MVKIAKIPESKDVKLSNPTIKILRNSVDKRLYAFFERIFKISALFLFYNSRVTAEADGRQRPMSVTSICSNCSFQSTTSMSSIRSNSRRSIRSPNIPLMKETMDIVENRLGDDFQTPEVSEVGTNIIYR